MLKFINEKEYNLLTLCKQIEPNTIKWQFHDGDKLSQGFFVKNATWPHRRTNEEGLLTEIDPFVECQTLCPVFEPLNVNEYNELLEAEEAYELLYNFKSERQRLLDTAVVTISTGKSFDADELSINRMVNAILAALSQDDSFIIKWSTADTGTGELVDCTLAELKEAHKLAMENMASIWSRE